MLFFFAPMESLLTVSIIGLLAAAEIIIGQSLRVRIAVGGGDELTDIKLNFVLLRRQIAVVTRRPWNASRGAIFRFLVGTSPAFPVVWRMLIKCVDAPRGAPNRPKEYLGSLIYEKIA